MYAMGQTGAKLRSGHSAHGQATCYNQSGPEGPVHYVDNRPRQGHCRQYEVRCGRGQVHGKVQ